MPFVLAGPTYDRGPMRNLAVLLAVFLASPSYACTFVGYMIGSSVDHAGGEKVVRVEPPLTLEPERGKRVALVLRDSSVAEGQLVAVNTPSPEAEGETPHVPTLVLSGDPRGLRTVPVDSVVRVEIKAPQTSRGRVVGAVVGAVMDVFLLYATLELSSGTQ